MHFLFSGKPSSIASDYHRIEKDGNITPVNQHSIKVDLHDTPNFTPSKDYDAAPSYTPSRTYDATPSYTPSEDYGSRSPRWRADDDDDPSMDIEKPHHYGSQLLMTPKSLGNPRTPQAPVPSPRGAYSEMAPSRKPQPRQGMVEPRQLSYSDRDRWQNSVPYPSNPMYQTSGSSNV